MKALQKQTYTTVADMLAKNKTSIASALPKHLSAERIARVALSELRTNPVLLGCEPASLVNAIVKASQLGLEVGGALGHAYLVPYKTEATLIVGYRGLIALARRSGEIQSLTARVVHERDTFELEYGLNEKLRHIPSTEADPGEMTHAYAVARLKDGGVQYEVMTMAEIESIRKRSRAGQSGPWVSDYEEMARKTVVRRLAKYLPISIEMADALTADQDALEVDITPQDDAVSRLNETIKNKGNGTAELDKPTENTVPQWPQWSDMDNEWLDSRGVRYCATYHSYSVDAPTVNSDGSFRKRRGCEEEDYRRYEAEELERVEMMAKQPADAEQNQEKDQAQ